MKNRCLIVVVLAIFATGGSAIFGESPAPSTGGPLVPAAGPTPCLCGFEPSGGTFCSTAVFCDDLDACADSSDCGAGFKCLVDNCCPMPLSTGACVPVCEDVECVNPGVCGTFQDCEVPLLVELDSFDAEFANGVVTLTWTTVAEFENAGFRILRARRDGSRIGKSTSDSRTLEVSLELVTQRLVPAQGDPLNGASYRYSDGAPHRPGTVSYYLVDVDYSGVATLHGPVHVEIPRRELSDGRRTR